MTISRSKKESNTVSTSAEQIDWTIETISLATRQGTRQVQAQVFSKLAVHKEEIPPLAGISGLGRIIVTHVPSGCAVMKLPACVPLAAVLAAVEGLAALNWDFTEPKDAPQESLLEAKRIREALRSTYDPPAAA
jgi:hypothetical protein